MVEPPAVRQERLAAMVIERGFLRVTDASEAFGISAVTVRSDLGRLEREGLIRRVHGGAMPAPALEREGTVEANATRDADIKRAIGRRAAALVTSGSSILLDVGSTALAVADALVDRLDLVDVVVVTNGIGIALALEAAIPRVSIVVTGGTLRPLQHSLVAPGAMSAFAELHVDLAIVGCNGVSDDGRVTNINLPETEVKRAMLGAATSSVLIADGSKAGQLHLGLVGRLELFDSLITAGSGVEQLRDIASSSGTRFVVADAI